MLTPLEIENKGFRRRLFGLDQEEVEEFVSLLLSDYEKLYKKNIELNDKMNVLMDSLNHYKNMEETMKNAILAAQKAGDELTQAAREKSDAILNQTKARISQAISEANTQIHKLESRYDSVRAEFEGYRTKMSAFLKAQEGILNNISDLSQIAGKDGVTNVSRLYEETQYAGEPEPAGSGVAR